MSPLQLPAPPLLLPPFHLPGQCTYPSCWFACWYFSWASSYVLAEMYRGALPPPRSAVLHYVRGRTLTPFIGHVSSISAGSGLTHTEFGSDQPQCFPRPSASQTHHPVNHGVLQYVAYAFPTMRVPGIRVTFVPSICPRVLSSLGGPLEEHIIRPKFSSLKGHRSKVNVM